MPTLEELKADLGATEARFKAILAEIEVANKEVKKDAIAQAKAIIKEHGLSAADLGLNKGAPKGNPKPHPLAGKKLKPKVIHPANGKTWSGRGTKPSWVKDLEEKQRVKTCDLQGTLV